MKILLSKIKVEGRLREDLGDVEELAGSIRDNGLLQPIVVEKINDPTYSHELRCGGRRFAAFTLLRDNKVPLNPEGRDWSYIDAVEFAEMPPHRRTLIELEENLRRKSMTWKETLKGIVDYHKAARRAALVEGESWSQAQTGSLLNMSQASVSIALKVWSEIVKGNKQVMEAESLTDAIKAMASQELDAAQAEMLRRTELKRKEMAENAKKQNLTVGVPITAEGLITTVDLKGPLTVAEKARITPEQVAAFYHKGNCLEVIPTLAKTTTINHIICDPPYGIDLDMLTRKDMGRFEAIERVADTHTVEGNLKLIPEFLEVAFHAIAEDGFLCMWYDLDHHEKIATWATKIGWKVQRWPLVWCKTSSCLNNAAQYNITKATEFCYFFRRSEQSIIKQKMAKNFVEAPTAATGTHPFCKPHEVWKYCLDAVSLPNQVILDPFAGEGSSLAAAFKEGRIPMGIEVDEKHIASGLSFIQEKVNTRSILDELTLPPL